MKYEVMFCECGRIHILNRSDYEWMKEDMKNRKAYHVCTNCGSTYVQYLDECLDGFCLCKADVRDKILTSDDKYKIYISNGIVDDPDVIESVKGYVSGINKED